MNQVRRLVQWACSNQHLDKPGAAEFIFTRGIDKMESMTYLVSGEGITLEDSSPVSSGPLPLQAKFPPRKLPLTSAVTFPKRLGFFILSEWIFPELVEVECMAHRLVARPLSVEPSVDSGLLCEVVPVNVGATPGKFNHLGRPSNTGQRAKTKEPSSIPVVLRSDKFSRGSFLSRDYHVQKFPKLPVIP